MTLFETLIIVFQYFFRPGLHILFFIIGLHDSSSGANCFEDWLHGCGLPHIHILCINFLTES